MTNKQIEYVSLIASGLTTLEIAQRQFVSHHTVRNTIAKAKERIGATSTANLVATSVTNKWIEPEDEERPIVYKVIEDA